MLGLHLLYDSLPNVDLEDDGKTHKEIERVYYGLISDTGWEQLKSCALVEDQEQWNFKTDKGSCRVRAYPESKRYEATVKSDSNETNSDVSEDFFNHFRAISDNGMVKRRYTYPIDTSKFSSEDKVKWEGLKWEVDIFYLPSGEFAPWCKIDLEVHTESQLTDGTRPAFPIDLKEVIVNEGQAKPLVRRLYEDYFIRKTEKGSLESAEVIINDLIAEGGITPPPADSELKTAFAEYSAQRTGDDTYGSEAYITTAKRVCELICADGGTLDTFVALHERGPLSAGDIPSKSSKGLLMDAGICINTIKEGDWVHGLDGLCDGIWTIGKEHGYFK